MLRLAMRPDASQKGHDSARGLLHDQPQDGGDPWAAAVEQRSRSSGIVGVGSGAGDSSDKLIAGHAGEEGEIGSATRSYLRKVEAWERGSRLRRFPGRHRPRQCEHSCLLPLVREVHG